ncbi:MAG TPA: 2-amino-4-hydroxy-6-hydroxymethyldihydropteridine diphosphokinase [Acidiferrobacterales bacterium]
MARCYVSIGSNIDKARHVRAAVRALAARYGPLAVSRVYESAPVGFDGESFYNLVVGFDTDDGADAVAGELACIETANGRRRDGERYGPRTLDLDLLLYGDIVRCDARSPLPHPDILAYPFVLRPLAEIAPGERHPVSGLTYAALARASAVDDSGLRVAGFQID